jgi:hypothetical protein
MNDFDAENHILRQKEIVRRAAESYPLISHLDAGNNDGVRLAYRRALAGLGGRLIVLGYRLQGEIDQLAAADVPEPLSFSSNGHAG